jgi:hypothetical protein
MRRSGRSVGTKSFSRSLRGLVLFVVVATIAALGGPASAFQSDEGQETAPTIASDKPDYAPGELVTLTGANWQPGESVHIRVNDDQGQTWSRDVDVVASETGTVVDQFNLPDWFVATYAVTATGSSDTATTSFTDGNLKVGMTPSSTTFVLDWALYNGASCAGSVKSSGTETVSGGSEKTLGVGNNESIKLQASATSGAGGAFSSWTFESGVTFTNVGPGTVCVVGFQSGSKGATANYSTAAPNSPPAIAATNASVTVNEGQTAINSGTWSDANAGDTVTLSASVGTVTKSGSNASGTWSWSYGTTDGPDQSQTVTITANDGHTTTNTTFALTVNNVKPTLLLTGPATAAEGDTKTYSFTVSDPGDDTFTIDAGYPTCDGGSLSDLVETASGGSFECTFPDGPATEIVALRVTDSDGASDTDNQTVTVTVANVAPTVTLTGDASADEGSTHTYTYTVTDPGDDTPVVTEDCGTNATYTDTAAPDSFECTFIDGHVGASSTVEVSADDGDPADNTGSDAIEVAVANVKPSIAYVSAPTTADEGDTRHYTFTYSDPGDDVVTVTQDCGDHGELVADSFAYAGGSGSFDCRFPDGPATTDVSVKATDSDGATDTDNQTVTVTVANVAPTVTLTGAASADEGSTHTYTYTVSDPGDDTPVVTEDCGTNATYTDTAAPDSFECTFIDGHTGASSTVEVSADDGDPADNTGSDAIEVAVQNVKPTINGFNPAGGSGVACASNSVSVSFTVGDPADEAHDPITGTITWGDGNSTPISGRTISESHSYAAGTYSLTATVNDGDGGQDSQGGSNNVSLLYTTSGILQPINLAGQRSGFKIGSTIPVKVEIKDCNGAPVTTLGPKVSLARIDTHPDAPVNELISSSAADTGTTMRYAGGDGHYIYNLSTKRSQFCPSSACSNGDLTQGSYRVRITDPTIAPVEAIFDLRK